MAYFALLNLKIGYFVNIIPQSFQQKYQSQFQALQDTLVLQDHLDILVYMEELVRRDQQAELVQPERRATRVREVHPVPPAEWVKINKNL